MRKNTRRAIVSAIALTLVAAACGDDSTSTTATAGDNTTAAASEISAAAIESTTAGGAMTPIKLQLQWFTQAQFAGYYAAVDQGFYKEEGLDVTILEGGLDITPQTVLASGGADYAIAWVPKALASREQGAGITDVAQIFQRSGTLQVSFKDKNITKAADLKSRKVGNWGFGNEFELFAGLTKAGLDPAKDITLVQQQFDMKALLSGDIDAAQAMIYNEYAQVLEAKNPTTGALYTAADFNVINWNDEKTSMLQDAIWANSAKLKSDTTYQDNTVKFIKASIKGWAYCRDNAGTCVDLVLAKGSKLGKSHQAWQMNEINKLVWPSPNGAGVVDKTQWDQTVSVAQSAKNDQGSTVITKAPDADAYTNDYVTKALAALDTAKVDTKGTGFTPATVTLLENGA
jgi:NitT/TauT family transport system substrate-binding protein